MMMMMMMMMMKSEGMIRVNPKDLRFTQDSIAVCFQSPHENWRIDDTVDMIVSKKLSPKRFPMLCVVRYQGILWSLDNRRLWVFRKAQVAKITVLLDPDFESRRRIVNLKSDRSLMARWSCESYFPTVRGKVRYNIRQQKLHLPPAAPIGFLDSENRPRLTPASTSLQSPAAASSRASHTVIEIPEVGAEGEIHTPEAEEEIPNPDAEEETPNPEAEGEIPTPDSEEDHIPNAGTEVRCGKLYRFFYWLISSVLKLFGIE